MYEHYDSGANNLSSSRTSEMERALKALKRKIENQTSE